MANFVNPIPCMQMVVDNVTNTLEDNKYICELTVSPQVIQGGNSTYTVNNIQTGFWLSNYPSSYAWKIIEITAVNSGANTMTVVVEDVEYYNFSLDPNFDTPSTLTPNIGQQGYCWGIDETVFQIYIM